MSFGRITKLNVHIANQTHITYANDATRLLTNNPSGFAFRSTGAASCSCVDDSLDQATRFLQRHFGKHGCIEKSSSLCALLYALGINYSQDEEQEQQVEQKVEEQQVEQEVEQQVEQQVKEHVETQVEHQAEQQADQQAAHQADQQAGQVDQSLEQQLETEQQHGEEANEEQPLLMELEALKSPQVQHTLQLELLPTVLPQWAITIEWHREQLQIFNCAWHLQNCNWRHVSSSEFQLPNCHCHKIKQMTEYINGLLKVSLPALNEQKEEEQKSKAEQQQSEECPLPDVNANIMSLNSLLQQLNELLEQQNEEQAV
ncbi:putative uncharacterized protein DDB_G0271606 isoform X2 [Drosophila sulfurigaster albostrigata]|uniref:putative uncharacterized protein DDB_G0271606 isoform X2 n=1 Tax=Drosophila sulfurigaster albostrigata TaxID=89887 RepID=UPI002D21D8E1|nr:putative uncharacterized protein DDB_G0271606 isoform X2 [Drosophila sulfurigaster albostrigata]